MAVRTSTSSFDFRLLARLTGVLLIAEAASMLLPIVVSAIFSDYALLGLSLSAVVVLAVGLLLRFGPGRGVGYDIRESDGFWVTSVVWLMVPLFGALPYWFSEVVSNPLDALFESFSGFTTTGSTIVADPSHLPKGLLVWRAMTQWIGGMGLILFAIAALRRMRGGALALYDAEFSGTAQRRLHPHLAESVRRMGWVYLGETLLLIVLLCLVGNDWVSSLCLGFSTVSTGGFMTAADGLTRFGESSKWIVAFFMLASGVNTALLYNLFTLRWHRLRQSDEFRTYLWIFLIAAVLTALVFLSAGNGLGESLRYALFHTAATVSTCGFFVDAPSRWSFGAATITFLLLFVGACTGSTGGGIKVKRILIVSRYIRNYFIRMVHPRAVFSVKVDGMVISDDYNNKIFAFVFMYLAFVLGGAFVLALSGVDISAALSMAAANMANLGPTPITGDLGVSLSYEVLPAVAKATLMVLMVAGRIEIFALVAMFSPSYWRRR